MAQFANQPPHASDLLHDHRILLNSISTAPTQYTLVEPYLKPFEQPVAIAVQRQFSFALFDDIVVLSTHRLIIFKQFFTKIDIFEVDHVDFEEVKIRRGFFASTLSIGTTDLRHCTVTNLISAQALNLYRLCQEIETFSAARRRAASASTIARERINFS